MCTLSVDKTNIIFLNIFYYKIYYIAVLILTSENDVGIVIFEQVIIKIRNIFFYAKIRVFCTKINYFVFVL